MKKIALASYGLLLIGLGLFFTVFDLTYNGFDFFSDLTGYFLLTVGALMLTWPSGELKKPLRIFPWLFLLSSLAGLYVNIMKLIAVGPFSPAYETFRQYNNLAGVFLFLLTGYGLALRYAPRRAKQWLGLIISLPVLILAMFITLGKTFLDVFYNIDFARGSVFGVLIIVFEVLVIALALFFYMTLFETRRDMKKELPAELQKNWLAPGAIIIAILILGVMQYVVQTKTDELGAIVGCEAVLDQGKQDACYLQLAETYPREGHCNIIASPATRNQCYFQVGELHHDASFCSQVKSSSLTSPVNSSSCYAVVADYTNDPALCPLIADRSLRENCYANISLHQKNLALCEKITDKAIKERCVQNFHAAVK